MKIKIICFYLILIPLFTFSVYAQKRNYIWCFGDSAGIDFNNISNPIAYNTSLVTRGTCVSIADSNGSTLFYANTRSGAGGFVTGLIWNRNHQIMLDGDSIAGGGWYHEMVIVPYPDSDSLYYLFSIGVTMNFGLMYSVIDISGDNGYGKVVQKNIPLLGGELVDCISAIKHGNGRDWWVLVRESPIGQPSNNNKWIVYLVEPSGIYPIPVQNVGELNGTNLGNISFSPDGTKLCFTNLGGLIELYDFNRCIGEVSNPVVIEPQLTVGPYPYTWSSEFSLSGRYLYITECTFLPSRLFQFDTWASNITTTKTLLWQVQNIQNYMGALKRGPDNRIYLSGTWTGGGFSFPYNSSQYYLENMYLTVINSPDSAGLICDVQPWSFYLGGKRTYWGLPNNPDYDLSALIGSPCDTLVGVNELILNEATAEMFLYYASNWQTAFINAKHVAGSRYSLEVYDIMGKSIFRESGKLNPPYFTKNLNCGSFATGVYTVVLQTEKERMIKRFVVE